MCLMGHKTLLNQSIEASYCKINIIGDPSALAINLHYKVTSHTLENIYIYIHTSWRTRPKARPSGPVGSLPNFLRLKPSLGRPGATLKIWMR